MLRKAPVAACLLGPPLTWGSPDANRSDLSNLDLLEQWLRNIFSGRPNVRTGSFLDPLEEFRLQSDTEGRPLPLDADNSVTSQRRRDERKTIAEQLRHPSVQLQRAVARARVQPEVLQRVEESSRSTAGRMSG